MLSADSTISLTRSVTLWFASGISIVRIVAVRKQERPASLAQITWASVLAGVVCTAILPFRGLGQERWWMKIDISK